MSIRRGDTWADVTSETTQLWCVTNNLVGTPPRADQPGCGVCALDHPVVVRDRDLGRDVILLEAEMRWRYRERVDSFPGRETLKFGNHDFNHEGPTWLQMCGNVPETGNLLVLRGQVHDRVADEVGKGERSVHRTGREVADRHTNVIRTRLRAHLRDHGRRKFNPVDAETTPAEW